MPGTSRAFFGPVDAEQAKSLWHQPVTSAGKSPFALARRLQGDWLTGDRTEYAQPGPASTARHIHKMM
jgi:hypothetical protein